MTFGLARASDSGTRRAFTLIEALVATALLAIVAAACMPLLRAASEGSDLSHRTSAGAAGVDRSLLVALAERVAQQPLAFGIDGSASGKLAVAWPEDLRQSAATGAAWLDLEVEILRPEVNAVEEVRGAARMEDRWIILRSGGESIARWCSVPRRSNGPSHRPRRVRRRRATVVRNEGSRARIRSGMTLVETLVAIAITSALATAVFAWTTTAARVASEVSTRASRDATAEAIFRTISDDVLCRDMEATNRAAGRRPVIVSGANLTIRTRSASPDSRGPVVRRYVADEATGELRVFDTHPDGSQRDTILARDVTHWRVSLDERGERLDVELGVGSAASLTRSFAVP
jgi:prepilin-type N-terminal cleavage/methylation domain-containing protein